ncbi:NosD domain-containing protein [Bacillus smithii]|uniref:right-handed parallel beta-helix repeat-containing protein n=1 Tax=Bacillus smithii TaxID=1479 RepID=UPI003D1EB565
MKTRIYVVFFLLLCFLFPNSKVHAEQNLQSMIQQAKPGDVIQLKGKTYKGPITISKPITLVGQKNTVIQSNGKRPTISLKGNTIQLKQLTVQQLSKDPKIPAISVKGNGHLIEGVTVHTKSLGIDMENVHRSKIARVTIKGSGKENGIIVSKSSENIIQDSFISRMLDAIYIENSDHNRFLRNTLVNSRYGFHLMFSKNLTIRENKSEKNYIGAMIMETSNSTIEDNTFSYNAQNVNSYGLQLFDTTYTKVAHNDFSHNRIGMKVEKSEYNQVFQNTALSNFIGIQFYKAHSNTVTKNTFVGNVNDIQAVNSKENDVNQNYWDGAWKLDIRNSGVSMIPYKADPFFLSLTEEVPEYQIFFQSPGMILLQKMLKSPDQLVLSDHAPLMTAQLNESKNTSTSPIGVWVVSIAMITISFSLITLGRKSI